jgi:AcrR family transcriptional regulator
LPPQARREEFIEKAIAFFAEQGFESSTRDLAKRLGVTQPLLYRYFPSKQDLIAEVYNTVYVNRWQAEWEGLIADRSRPLEERLTEFYRAYTDAIFKPEWIRIFLYSGLKGVEINTRYMALVVEKVLGPIITECRRESGAPARAPNDEELDFAWILHGGIFYYGVVKLVYEGSRPSRKDRAIEHSVRAMIAGLKEMAATGDAGQRGVSDLSDEG